ncbi:oligosaccharide flippase family protein [Porticoccaceae bacterium]|nr:oligosaccharide flippase family protein [Porticoccaceae bacterium]
MGNAVSHGITFFGVLLLSRVYSPKEFGVYAVVLGCVAILSAVASFQYETTILLPKLENLARLALQVALIAVLGNILIIFLAVSLMVVGGWLDIYWLALPVAGLFSSVINIGSFLQNRNQQYKRIVGIQVLRALLFVLTALVVSPLGTFDNGLVVGMTIAYVVPGFWVLLVDFRRSKLYEVKLSKSRCIFWIKKHNKFLYYSAPAVFVSTIASQAPVFLLTVFAGAAQAGYYAMVYRAVMAPVMLFSKAVNRIYMQSVTAKMAAGDIIYPFTVLLIKRCIAPGCLVGGVMLVLFYFGALEFVLGRQWVGVDTLAAVMMPAFLVSFIGKSISGFAVLGRNELGLIYQLLLLTLVSSAVVLSTLMSGDIVVIFSCISFALSTCFIGQALSILRISSMIDKSNLPGK